MQQTVKDRIVEFIKFKNITSRVFEKQCNLSNGYLRQLRNSPSADKIEMIISAFPELRREWLMAGEGDMLKREEEYSKNENNMSVIPLLPVSAQGGTLGEFSLSVKRRECEMVVSPIIGADFAIPVTGDSMAPEYPNGSQVHIKRINEKAFIEWGKVYVIDTCNGVIIKRIVPSENEGCIKCLSINPSPIYAPFDVNFCDINGIYRVMLCLSVK